MTITIFLIADDEPSDRLCDMVADWTAAGLLDESMWVRTGEWQRGERALHDVGVEVLSGTARHDHLLLPLLGPRRIGHVRLVVVHLAVSRAAGDTPLTGAARALVGLLTNRLPADTGITVLNVMVPSSESGQLPRSMLLELPTVPVVNIAVAPEDRRSDAHADIAVRNGPDGNFTGHAVLGCVTVAGLWRGVDAGPLDTSSLASAFDEDVVVTRCFASLVWCGPVVDDVSAQVLAPRASWPLPEGLAAGPGQPADDPAAVVDRVAAGCRDLGRGVLRWRPAPRPAPAVRRRVSALRLLPGMAGFVVTRVWRPPADLAVHATPAVLERATRLTRAGTDPAAPVVASGPGAEATLDDLAHQAATVLAAAGEAVPPEPDQGDSVWDELRAVAFALVDGAALPPVVDAGALAGRGHFVGRAELIGPDPWAPDTAAVERGVAALHPESPPALAGGGPFEARRLQAVLAAAAAPVPAAAGPGSTEPVDAGPDSPAAGPVAVAGPGPAAGPGPTEPVDAGRDDPAAGPVAVTGPGPVAGPGRDPAAGPEVEEDSVAGPERPVDIDATVAALDAWTARRSGSLLWKVSEAVADDIGAARREMAGGLSALGRQPEVTGSRALRRMWATCRRTCLTAIVLALALIAGYRLAHISSSDFVVATSATVVLALLVATIGFWRYRRVEVGLANGIERDRATFETGSAQAIQGAAEVVRLVGLYRRLQEWATVIGAFVHRPFGLPPAPRPAAAPPPGAGLAMACNLAQAQVSDEQIRWLSAGAGAALFGPGWLGRAYDDLVEAGPHRPVRPMGGRTAANGDSRTVGTDATALSSEVLDSGFAGWAHRRGRAEVAAFCLAQPVRRLVSSVTPAQPEVDADGPVEGELALDAFVARTLPSRHLQQFLLGELWSETARVRLAHRVERMAMWGPPGVAGSGAGGDLAEWTVLANVEGPDGQLVLRVIRLDCSARTPSRDLRLFTSVVTPVSRA